MFHPNTIAYAVPTGSALAKEIGAAKIGIVWHTTYSGATFETMRAEFGKEIVPKLKSSKDVWMVDATLSDLSGTATLTKKDTELLNGKLSAAGKLFKKISGSTLKELESNKELNLVINVYNNRKVRNGQE